MKDNITKQQDEFAKREMERESQSVHDRAEIKVKLIDNGILVKVGAAWLAFPTWAEASEHVGARLEKLRRERDGAPRGGC